MKLQFSFIKNGTVFEPEFQVLTASNGTIEFKQLSKSRGIAVVYAPNGTGKSSMAKVLGSEKESDSLSFIVVNDDGTRLLPGAFHVIPDQVNRNVIHGKETDYLVGQQIRREYELRDRINAAFETAYSALASKFKNEYKVSKVGDYLLSQIGLIQEQPYISAFTFLRSIVNNREHGKTIDKDSFVAFIRKTNHCVHLGDLDSDKVAWVIEDCGGGTRIIEQIHNHRIVANAEAVQIERHDDAINILKKYCFMDTCVVCDNPDYHGTYLLAKKQEQRQRIYDNLDQNTKQLLDRVVQDTHLSISDPFSIKRIVSDFIGGGTASELCDLKKQLDDYVHSIGDMMINDLLHCFDGTSLLNDFDEYTILVSTAPKLDSEELLFIEDIISENIGKDITIERDDEKNYRILTNFF